MSEYHVISIIGLVVIFVIATALPVHMGALAFGAAFVVGTLVVGESTKQIIAGFPGDLFLVLVGVTLLFAIAKENGTIDWLVHRSVQAVGGRVAAIPWVMFAVTALLTSFGAVGPAAVAIIAPIGMGFAARYKIKPVLMGLMVANGSSAGGFSPLGILGSIVNGVVDGKGLPSSPLMLFLSSMFFNIGLCVVVFFIFGGRALLGKRVSRDTGKQDRVGGGVYPTVKSSAGGLATAAVAESTEAPLSLNTNRALTLAGIGGLAVGALAFSLDIGFMAISVAVLLSLAAPNQTKKAVDKVAWSTVLLVCGIVTYVALMERIGTIKSLGDSVAGIGAPLLAAILICYIGAVVSAFASTTGILGALIPLAVPFLQTGDIGAVGLIVALSISSSVVDASPFSTSGALAVANSGAESDTVFRQLMIWGFSMVAIAPILTWLIFILPGWL
jgi:Na+/H+ antiporter NhaD/arsenite permease-like protein